MSLHAMLTSECSCLFRILVQQLSFKLCIGLPGRWASAEERAGLTYRKCNQVDVSTPDFNDHINTWKNLSRRTATTTWTKENSQENGRDATVRQGRWCGEW
jgi:hypothetical protein